MPPAPQQLSDRFVKDPHSVVKAGDKLRVRVLEVDPARKRISLSAKLGEPAPAKPRGGEARAGSERGAGAEPGRREPAGPRRDGVRETQPRGGDFGHNPFARLLKR